jgi:hypothetical protein
MKIRLLAIAFVFATGAFAQEKLTYQKPPKEILELVDVERAPSVRIDNKGEFMVLLYRDGYKTLAELSETELRLAGLRINPKTNIGSRTTYYKNIKVKTVTEKISDRLMVYLRMQGSQTLFGLLIKQKWHSLIQQQKVLNSGC